tara:strand:- start:472 stop:789 length:318 start_codon:yes stop_codon:yes gene_type:complete
MKTITIILVLVILNGCSTYKKPIVDTRGRSDSNIQLNMDRYWDDYYTCKELTEDNSSDIVEGSKKLYNVVFRPKLLWLSPKAEDRQKQLMKNCLSGRGYSVVGWE